MIRYFVSALQAHLRGSKLVFLLTVGGVALGVAGVVCIQIINQSATSVFSAGVSAIYGKVDLTVVPRGPALSADVYPRVLAHRGIHRAWPRIDLLVRVESEQPLFLDLKGIDLAAPQSARVAPSGVAPNEGALAPFEHEGFVALSRDLAEHLALQVGDPLPVSTGSKRVELKVGALYQASQSPVRSTRLAWMDIADAEILFEREGELDAIDVAVAEEFAPDELAGSLQAELGEGIEVLTPGDQQERAVGLLDAFRLNLTALSLISWFVGTFLVFGTMQAALIRRRREFGILRTLGATGGQVLLLVLSQALLLGAIGTAIGLPLGVAAARSSLDAVGGALIHVYLLREAMSLEIPPWLPLLALCVGLCGALAGAIGPAFRLRADDPRSMLSPLQPHERLELASPWLAATAGALWSIALCWFLFTGKGLRSSGFILGMVLMVSLPLAAPFALSLFAGAARSRGFGLLYAARSARARLHSGAVAAASLAVAASMLFGVTAMIESFRKTVADWVAATLRADIYVSGRNWPRGAEDSRLADAVVQALANDEQVASIDLLRRVFVTVDGSRIAFAGVDIYTTEEDARFPLIGGDDATAMAQVKDGGAILLAEPLAHRLKLRPGEQLRVPLSSGTHSFPVAGTYYDYSSASGSAVMSLETMQRVFGPAQVNSLGLHLKPGVDPDAHADLLRERFRDLPLNFASNARLRKGALQIFDQTFFVTRILQGIALCIAAFGIALALLTQARELAGEIALYGALGASRLQVFLHFVGKGLALGVVGLGLGAIGGAGLYWILSDVINRAFFGWTIQTSFPAAALLGQLVLILVAIALASMYPAWLASRTSPTLLAKEHG